MVRSELNNDAIEKSCNFIMLVMRIIKNCGAGTRCY